MTLLSGALLAGSALIACAVAALVLRRSLPGLLIGIQLAAGGGAVIAAALGARTGEDGALGQVVASWCIALAVAAAVVLAALHVTGARASHRAEELEPW